MPYAGLMSAPTKVSMYNEKRGGTKEYTGRKMYGEKPKNLDSLELSPIPMSLSPTSNAYLAEVQAEMA